MRNILRSTVAVTTLVVLMSAAAHVWAESHAPVRTGSTVRVILVDPKYGSIRVPKSREGTLISLTETEIALETTPESPPLLLQRAGIERYDVKTRVGRRKVGALWGAGIGAMSGLFIGAAIVGNTENDPNDWSHSTALESGAFWAALLVLPGAAIGALVAPGEKWREFDPAQVHVGCMIDDSGVMGLRIAGKF